MKINTSYLVAPLAYKTQALLKRMLGPLCGIDHEIGFMLPSARDANVIIAGAEMAGVHTLLNLPHPGRGAYHLGGCGINLNEAVIATLGETVERYCQITAEVAGLKECRYASYQQMLSFDKKVIPFDKINYFLSQQFYQKSFPYDLFSTDQPVTWVKLDSLLSRDYLWVPAQLIFVGYKIKRDQCEPWIASAVTSGTAAHTDQQKALVSAILELIQIDSAIGHWYSSQSAPMIEHDDRTLSLVRLLQKFNFNQTGEFTFHWLRNPDLPGFNIACVYRSQHDSFPKVSVGLGSSMKLTEAMYKAFLESVGIIGLSRMVLFDRQSQISENLSKPIYDLDSNVACYAMGYQREWLETKKFPMDVRVRASSLPPDIDKPNDEIIRLLLHAFSINQQELLFYDLTNTEARELGFVVPRVWSSDLLPLCLPSAPHLNHQRFLAYGGVSHEFPHPYP